MNRKIRRKIAGDYIFLGVCIVCCTPIKEIRQISPVLKADYKVRTGLVHESLTFLFGGLDFSHLFELRNTIAYKSMRKDAKSQYQSDALKQLLLFIFRSAEVLNPYLP